MSTARKKLVRRVALDTSVLVAALWAAHPRHAEARRLVESCHSGGLAGIASAHALAECWATLTALPLSARIRPLEAREMVLVAAHPLEVVATDLALEQAAMERCARLGLRSGSIYDALHLCAAEGANAAAIATFNKEDFTRLKPTIGVEVPG